MPNKDIGALTSFTMRKLEERAVEYMALTGAEGGPALMTVLLISRVCMRSLTHPEKAWHIFRRLIVCGVEPGLSYLAVSIWAEQNSNTIRAVHNWNRD